MVGQGLINNTLVICCPVGMSHELCFQDIPVLEIVHSRVVAVTPSQLWSIPQP